MTDLMDRLAHTQILSLMGHPIALLKHIVRQKLMPYPNLSELAAMLIWVDNPEAWEAGIKQSSIEMLLLMNYSKLLDECNACQLAHEKIIIRERGGEKEYTHEKVEANDSDFGVNTFKISEIEIDPTLICINYWTTLEDYCAANPQCRLCQWLNEDAPAGTHTEERPAQERRASEFSPREVVWPETMSASGLKRVFTNLKPKLWENYLHRVDELKSALLPSENKRGPRIYRTREVIDWLLEQGHYQKFEIDKIMGELSADTQKQPTIVRRQSKVY